MTKILGISGSLRANSFNTALLRAMAELSGSEVEFEVRTLHGIPLYDGDVEDEEGSPETVKVLAEAIMAADGVILCTPEYNHSIPGVFKNAVDWLSRLEDEVFSGKAVALAGVTPGGFGTVLAQDAWLAVLRALEAQVWTQGRLVVSKGNGLFDGEGKLIDEGMGERLKEYVEGFADFAAGC